MAGAYSILPAFPRRGGCDIKKTAASLAEQTGRLVPSDNSERYAGIYKDASRLYQPPRPRYARAALLKKEGSIGLPVLGGEDPA